MKFIINDFMDEMEIYNSYVVELEWEHGVCPDFEQKGYTGTYSKPFKKGQDEWVLEEFLYDLYDLNKLSRKEYEESDLFNKWFNPDYKFKDEEERVKYEPFINLDFEEDMIEGGNAFISSYKVYYFDESSHAYKVIVID